MGSMRIFKQVPRILFGRGTLERLPELLPAHSGTEGYLVYVIDDVHYNNDLIQRMKIENRDLVEWFPATVTEPSTYQVDVIRDRVLAEKSGFPPTAVVGIGGGSTMDVGKALAVMINNEGSSSEYQGWDLVCHPAVYKVGIPTLSGSGAEASRTAVLMGKDRKFGINSDYSMFDAIILDSTLIDSVSPEQRFYSGMDCFIHCVESLEGTMINQLSKSFAEKALELCDLVFSNQGNDDMLMSASYMGGVSIVNSEVGICHALSYGLSLELGCRHGLANCIVFKSLGGYYGQYVERFNKMLETHRIKLPQGLCQSLDEQSMTRMVEMTLKMDRPLTNALGPKWRNKLPKDEIFELYNSL